MCQLCVKAERSNILSRFRRKDRNFGLCANFLRGYRICGNPGSGREWLQPEDADYDVSTRGKVYIKKFCSNCHQEKKRRVPNTRIQVKRALALLEELETHFVNFIGEEQGLYEELIEDVKRCGASSQAISRLDSAYDSIGRRYRNQSVSLKDSLKRIRELLPEAEKRDIERPFKRRR
jgi:hypothetical protein